jgi:hypothetical protein
MHESNHLQARAGVQFDKEPSQTRDYCVAKTATPRAARPDSSRRKERLFGMTTKLNHLRPRFLRAQAIMNVFPESASWRLSAIDLTTARADQSV